MAPVDSRDYVGLLNGIYYSVLVLVYTPSKHDVDQMLAHRLRRWPSIKPALVQRLVFAGLRSTQETQNICTMRRRRWAGVVQMLYKCFVFAGNSTGRDYKPTPTQCLVNVEPASPVLASKHSVLIGTSFVTVCDGLQPFAIVCDHLRSFATICDRLRPFAIICDGLRLFAIVSDHLRSFATVRDRLR